MRANPQISQECLVRKGALRGVLLFGPVLAISNLAKAIFHAFDGLFQYSRLPDRCDVFKKTFIGLGVGICFPMYCILGAIFPEAILARPNPAMTFLDLGQMSMTQILHKATANDIFV